MNKQSIGAKYYGESTPLSYYNWKNDAKIHFNKSRIYRKKGFYESLKEDYERFTKSKWQVKRDVNIDYIISLRRQNYN